MHAEALAGAPTLLVAVGVDALHLLDKISSVVANQRVQVVFFEARVVRYPERYVFVADRVLYNTGVYLTERLEFRDLPVLELLQKARVLAPKQTNVRNIEQLHCKALKTQSGCPGDVVGLLSGILEDRRMENSTAQHFQPLTLVENLKLERREGEGEVGVDPSHVNISEEVLHEALQTQLEVVGSLHHAHV